MESDQVRTKRRTSLLSLSPAIGLITVGLGGATATEAPPEWTPTDRRPDGELVGAPEVHDPAEQGTRGAAYAYAPLTLEGIR